MQYPKISIVTPSFNQGEFIEQTILSVLEQNYPNLEYIIIDGGSTDNTLEIIKKYEKHLAYWVSEPDRGQSHAINKGLEKCTGEIFNWLNSDDYLEDKYLFTIANIFSNAKIEVCCGITRCFHQNNIANAYNIKVTINPVYEYNLVRATISQPSTFYRKKIIDSLGGINENLHYCMDVEIWMCFLLEKTIKAIQIVDTIGAYARLHHNSKTVLAKKHFSEEVNLIEKILFCNVTFRFT